MLAQAARVDFPAVREAAEHAVVKLRALAPGTPISAAPELLRPFLLACNHTMGGGAEVGMVSRALEALQRVSVASEIPATLPRDLIRVLALQVRDVEGVEWCKVGVRVVEREEVWGARRAGRRQSLCGCVRCRRCRWWYRARQRVR